LIYVDIASSPVFLQQAKYLEKVNATLDEKEWRISCVLLAPHAPDQNHSRRYLVER